MAMYWAIIGVLADSAMRGSLGIWKTAGKDAGGAAKTYRAFASIVNAVILLLA
jgi:hypothetical protein